MQVLIHSRFFLLVFGLLWVATVSAGMGVLAQYENTPGDVGTPSVMWPEGSRLSRVGDQMTLVVFAHPRCPCTRASIEELARIMAHAQGRVQAHVVFVLPEVFDKAWTETDLWVAAQIIPGVVVQGDRLGVETRAFGVATSGHTLLYDAGGTQVFSGGITGSRGHSGDNAGRSQVIALITEKSREPMANFVFGCSLFDAPME